MKEKRPADFILRFCRDVVGLESLHFGLWESEYPRTIDGLKAAQDNYSRFLLEHIPAGTTTILDAGCGTGELSERLVEAGYTVTALTPDSYLAEYVTKRLGDRADFALSKFEEFETQKKFDLIIMSESCQYMSHHLMFPKARELLTDGGHMLISDYFRNQEMGTYYETVWTESEFTQKLEKSNFKIAQCDDITEKTLPTLDLGKKVYSGTILPTIELVRDLLLHVIPGFIVGPIRFFIRKQLALAADFLYNKQPEQFDSARFKENLHYRVLLLEKC
jgi:cyclopropane fatty-acyl-phospholipid synthase-like methyltransferase